MDVCYIEVILSDIVVYNSESLSQDFPINFDLWPSTDNIDCGFLNFKITSTLSNSIILTNKKITVSGANLPVGDYAINIEAIVATYPGIFINVDIIVLVKDACEIT